MDRMGYDIMAVGERELGFGYDYFLALTAPTEMQVLNSNIEYAPLNKKVGKEYAMLETGGVKVGFFSLYFHQKKVGRKDPLEGGGFVTEDAVEAARRVLPRLHKKCDVVVLLAHGPWKDIEDFLNEVSDFDLVIAAHDGGIDRAGREVNGTTVMRAGNRGQFVGKVALVVSPEGDVELRSKEIISVKTSLPEDPDVVKMIKETNEKYNEMRRAEALTTRQSSRPKRGEAKYLGDAVCRRCHEDVYQAWLGTPHALAYEKLEEKGMQGDSDCVMCHTTGHGDATGFVLLPDEQLKAGAAGSSPGGSVGEVSSARAALAEAQADMRNVQCESCHGKGTSHSRGTGNFLRVSESQCTICHDKKNSPDFDYGDYLPHVSCKALLEDSD